MLLSDKLTLKNETKAKSAHLKEIRFSNFNIQTFLYNDFFSKSPFFLVIVYQTQFLFSSDTNFIRKFIQTSG